MMRLLPQCVAEIGMVRVWALPGAPRAAPFAFTTPKASRCVWSPVAMLAVTLFMHVVVDRAGQGATAAPVFWLALLTSITSCFVTCLCDPGILPPWGYKTNRPLRVTTRSMDAPGTTSSTLMQSQYHNALLDDEPYRRDYMLPYCSRCQHLRPATTVHCSVAECCVQHLDHYCVFLGCCVGARNLRWFVLYQAAFVVADAVAQFAWIWPSFLNAMDRHGWKSGLLAAHLLLIVTGVPYMVGTFGLCVFYLLRVTTGRNSRAPSGTPWQRLVWMVWPARASLVTHDYVAALRALPPAVVVGGVASPSEEHAEAPSALPPPATVAASPADAGDGTTVEGEE